MSFFAQFFNIHVVFRIVRHFQSEGERNGKNDDILPLKTMCITNTVLILILKSGSQKRFHDIKK
jgi:hypothetical protein